MSDPKAAQPEHRAPNALARETSPYLLQHAYNPVAWLPWGEAAFQKARAENKPIFLSVGYSSCHWCHVMEKESFEDEETARLLNQGFVSIKVDREERPDVDAIYMTAVQLMSGSGGWPMSVFLTPDLKPFYGGTYFPPVSMYGRIGFKDLLVKLQNLYSEQPGKIAEVSEEMTARLGQQGLAPSGKEAPGPRALEISSRYLGQIFDSTFGGFGPAPKFPHSMDIAVLLRHWRSTGVKLSLDMAVLTLRKMAEGGIYDQVGGGFHRYSVDRQWLVPHFEKMLYDNALLARIYCEAFQASGDGFFRRTAGEILDYIIRDMTAPDGGFFSATDADSEGEEGKFFVWTPEEIEAILGIEAARPFCLYYNITPGGNFENSTSIPHVTRPAAEVAAGLKMEPSRFESVLQDARLRLYEARERRVRPFRDEKIIAGWNGLMISAMARGFQVLGENRFLKSAERAARFQIERHLRDGALLRIWKDGQAKIPAFLDDYAYLAEGLLDLYEASFKVEYLERARMLTGTLLAGFAVEDGSGFYYTAAGQADLIHRRTDLFDNATPSGNWVAAHNLLRLERLTGDAAYGQAAGKILAGLEDLVDRAPMGFAAGIVAADRLFRPPVEIAIVGEPGSPDTQELVRAVHRSFIPEKTIAGGPGGADAALAARVPLLAGKDRVGGKAAVYVCENFACKAPVTSGAGVEEVLAERKIL